MKKNSNIKEMSVYTLPVSEMHERLELTVVESALIQFCKKAREIPTKEILKFDFYCHILKELLSSINTSESKMRVLVKDNYLQLPGEIMEIVKNKKISKLTLKDYKKRNWIMEKIIPIYQDILALEEEQYGKINSERILDAIQYAFEKGVPYIGLFYRDTTLDFRRISEAVRNTMPKPYYMFSGNNIDVDEYITFGTIYGYKFSGVVITNGCSTKDIESLVNEYFKQKDLFDVFIFTV